MHCISPNKKNNSFFDFAESILFDTDKWQDVDYRKLEVDSSAYDVIYEKNVRRKSLNLIYILDEIRQEMGYAGSQCIDLLIQIEKTVHQGKMRGASIDDSVLRELVTKFADGALLESDFVAERISSWEYKIMRRKFLYLDPLNDKGEFICELRKFARNVQENIGADDFYRKSLG